MASDNTILAIQTLVIPPYKQDAGDLPQDDEPPVGITTTSYKPGEAVTLMAAGTSIMPLEESAWRSHIAPYINAARQLGHGVPERLLVHAGQLFWEDGKITEARLSGLNVIGEPDTDGVAQAQGWNSPIPPHFTRGEQGELILAPDDQGRTHMSFLITGQDEPSGRAMLVITLDLSANQRLSKKLDKEAKSAAPPLAAIPRQIYLHASQEIDALERSACDGSRGLLWRNNEQQQARIWERRGTPHLVRLPSQPENGTEETLEALEELALAQDADFAFTLSYVISALAPPTPLPENRFAGGWINLNRVMEGIGWHPSKMSTHDRAEARKRMWDYLQYGDRAVVTGRRTIPYYDAQKDEIPTYVDSPVWRIMDRPRLEVGEAPDCVQIVINKAWEPLLTAHRLAQYLPLGEMLTNIPPTQITGSWARIIGLVLARQWRMSPRETMHTSTKASPDGGLHSLWVPQIQPSRRELLTTYTPKTKTVEDLLKSKDPKRAVKYWHGALRLLADVGFIEDASEAKRSIAQTLKPYEGKYGWGDAWLDGKAKIAPGPKMQQALQERADALPPLKPKDLSAPKKRVGRPRKWS